MIEAAKCYIRLHPRHMPIRTVAEVVEDMLVAKEAQGFCAGYVGDLRSTLRRFATQFPRPITQVLALELRSYLTDYKACATTKNSVRKNIRTLFHFAQSRGYLPKGETEADDLPRVKETPQPITIYSPVEMAKLLLNAEEDVLPFLAIGAFAGLRTAEILRLDWNEVDLAGGLIEVKATKAKTGNRRLVPISPNLKQWLAPLHQGTGKVFVIQQLSHKLRKLTAKESVGFKWKHNALRHSYISYRVAQVQNVAQVALEAGNSPKIIFANYRELVKPTDAVKWFDIQPETPANVIMVPQPTAAVA
jgi:integrase